MIYFRAIQQGAFWPSSSASKELETSFLWLLCSNSTVYSSYIFLFNIFQQLPCVVCWFSLNFHNFFCVAFVALNILKRMTITRCHRKLWIRFFWGQLTREIKTRSCFWLIKRIIVIDGIGIWFVRHFCSWKIAVLKNIRVIRNCTIRKFEWLLCKPLGKHHKIFYLFEKLLPFCQSGCLTIFRVPGLNEQKVVP